MLLTKEIEIIPSGASIKYYKDLGYDAKYHVPLVVKIDDLPKGSGEIVDVLCDFCKKNVVKLMYTDYVRRLEKYGDSACINCKPIKTQRNNLMKYGYKSPSCTKEIKEKIMQTNIERYGYPCSLQNKKIRQNAIDTCNKHYGVDYSIQSKEIYNKTIDSLERNYGVRQPSQSPIIRKKIAETFYKNSSQKTSSQQSYLHKLYGGELNYPISHMNADICLIEEKIDIEYNGGGHNLNVKMGKVTQEAFNQKEIIRNNIIKRAGYKQITIISSKDFLPSDKILLNMLEQAKQYFYTTDHTWVEYNIDTSLMRNAENKEGVFFDFGELRKVKNQVKEVD